MRIASRGSALALWQARAVARRIEQTGGPACEIVVVRTSGDEPGGPPEPPVAAPVSTASPPNVKRMFVKEIEEALLEGRVDLAVHSCKDLPATLPDGLIIAAALEREDPRDALVLASAAKCDDPDAVRAALGSGPRIGTSSVRRIAQLRTMFPDATFNAIRGNVDTRLRKLDDGACDALVLAAAGLKRLDLAERVSTYLPIEVCVPAPGQGIVAVEVAAAAADSRVRNVASAISDADAETALLAERAVVQALGAGCQMPLGAIALLDGQELTVIGLVASLDGRRVIRAVVHGNRGGAARVGEKLARALLEKGATEILAG
jgi:hydroxymethylbilane synthase